MQVCLLWRQTVESRSACMDGNKRPGCPPPSLSTAPSSGLMASGFRSELFCFRDVTNDLDRPGYLRRYPPSRPMSCPMYHHMAEDEQSFTHTSKSHTHTQVHQLHNTDTYVGMVWGWTRSSMGAQWCRPTCPLTSSYLCISFRLTLEVKSTLNMFIINMEGGGERVHVNMPLVTPAKYMNIILPCELWALCRRKRKRFWRNQSSNRF